MDFQQIAISSLVAAFSTFLTGFIWYHPKVFGTIWMREEGLTEEQINSGNPLKIYGSTLLLAFLLGFCVLSTLVIHQFGAFGLVNGNAEDKAFIDLMATHGDAFRTFKHGALHGFTAGLLFALPVIAINGLFSFKSWRLILIQGGYWIITLTIMGAIICGWK